ncbi:MAG: hypothetical protein AB8E82_20015, partial [Aureispira sp.]
KPFDKNATFLGSTVLESVRSLPMFSQKRMFKIFEELGLPEILPDNWYPMNILMDFYKQLQKAFGPNTLFDMGKAIPENAVFPPGIDSIETGLGSINMAYNMNHRGYIGFHQMVSHDTETKTIIMQNHTPFPPDVDRGIYTGMARRFKTGVKVVLNNTELEREGKPGNRYIITYR